MGQIINLLNHIDSLNEEFNVYLSYPIHSNSKVFLSLEIEEQENFLYTEMTINDVKKFVLLQKRLQFKFEEIISNLIYYIEHGIYKLKNLHLIDVIDILPLLNHNYDIVFAQRPWTINTSLFIFTVRDSDSYVDKNKKTQLQLFEEFSLEYLLEINLIEEIINIDYNLPYPIDNKLKTEMIIYYADNDAYLPLEDINKDRIL